MKAAVNTLLKRSELFFWFSALLLLFFMPWQSGYSLCPLKAVGFPYCWGCGIGNAIHHALRGEWLLSWQHHFFGIPATLIIFNRILQIIRKNKINAISFR